MDGRSRNIAEGSPRGILRFLCCRPFHRSASGLNNLISVHNQFSSTDGTVRYLLRLGDGEFAEAVRIPRQDRVTICISSQVGCALGCVFCLTAQLGLTRDLSSEEIV